MDFNLESGLHPPFAINPAGIPAVIGSPDLFRLAEQHEHAGASGRGDGELFFLRRERHGHAVGMRVVNRFAVRQQHVIMRAMAGEIGRAHV